MHHTIKSILAIIILLAIVIAIGFVVSSGDITGAVISHAIACFDDSDCDDDIAATEDICRNPGTEFSLCINKPIDSN